MEYRKLQGVICCRFCTSHFAFFPAWEEHEAERQFGSTCRGYRQAIQRDQPPAEEVTWK